MKRLDVKLVGNEYPIFIDNGLIDRLPEFLEPYKENKIAIITDTRVYSLYGKKVMDILKNSSFDANIITVKEGEQSKSITVLNELYNKLSDLNICRNDLIIALGGGVVGDLTGFVASTFLRGVRFIQIPTTLLAQIDSSIGGKVAINTDRGKNLAGSFYHPQMVIIDTFVLSTLDKRVFADGMAEAIKYGCIKDSMLFELIEKSAVQCTIQENINEIIYKCCEIKKEVVQRDEKETGERMILNFGHTLGHAIEKYFDYSKYMHGEAVAIGMSAIIKAGETMGITQKGTSNRVDKVIKNLNLKTEIPENIDMNIVSEIMTKDKKARKKAVNMVFITKIGETLIKEIPFNQMSSFPWKGGATNE